MPQITRAIVGVCYAMLAKSKTNAFVLSAIAVLSFGATGVVVNILVPYLLSGDLRVVIERPENLRSPGDVAVMVGLVVLLLLMLQLVPSSSVLTHPFSLQ